MYKHNSLSYSFITLTGLIAWERRRPRKKKKKKNVITVKGEAISKNILKIIKEISWVVKLDIEDLQHTPEAIETNTHILHTFTHAFFLFMLSFEAVLMLLVRMRGNIAYHEKGKH